VGSDLLAIRINVVQAASTLVAAMEAPRMNILFVDDNVETGTLFQLVFRLEGHQTELAFDGCEALDILDNKAHAFDVIILDYHMPRMDGLDVVRQLKGRKRPTQTPIILFTGDAQTTLENQAQKLGVARVIHKPILPSQLLAIAHDVLNAV
jgi:two-component system chemotaxis response regulator CheY